MVDLHIHILPGLDDGARSWDEALEMAEMAAESGVTALAATIHANLPYQKQGDRERLFTYREQLRYFRQLLEQEKIPLTVYSGMEIFVQGNNFVEKIKKGTVLTLNHTPYVLIEFPMDVAAAGIYRAVFSLLDAHLIPVLAHPERYDCVCRVPDHVYEWFKLGAVIQMNKGSILGRFGPAVMETAYFLLQNNLVSVVASDAHRPYTRTPDMTEVCDVLSSRYGRERAVRLLSENPRRILLQKFF